MINLIYNSLYCEIIGDYDYEVLHRATSYSVPGNYFIRQKIGYQWDGRNSLLVKQRTPQGKRIYFPTGLIYHVMDALKRSGITEINAQNISIPPALEKNPINLDAISLRDYQEQAVEDMAKYSRGIIHHATGTGKSETMIAFTQYSGLRTLFAVYGNDLVVQTYQRYQKRLGNWLNQTGKTLGILHGGKCITGDILVASISKLASMMKKHYPTFHELVSSYDVLLLDEVHMKAAKTFYRTCMGIPAYYRFGASGTPLSRGDNANRRIIAITGPVISRVSNKEMMERGVLAKTTVEFLPMDDPKIPPAQLYEYDGFTYADLYKLFIVNNEARNKKICEKAAEWSSKNHGIVVLIREIEHGKVLKEMIEQDPYNLGVEFVYGNDSIGTRTKLKEAFKSGELKVLIASTIFDQGIDLPNIDVLILGGGGKSHIKTLQRLGRGLRGSFLHVIEFADRMHYIFRDQSLERLRHYQKEDTFRIVLASEGKYLGKSETQAHYPAISRE